MKAPSGVPKVIAPAFPLKFPPEPVSVKEFLPAAAASHPHRIAPSCGFEDASRYLQPIAIAGHGSQQRALLDRLKIAGSGDGVSIVDGLKALSLIEWHRRPFRRRVYRIVDCLGGPAPGRGGRGVVCPRRNTNPKREQKRNKPHRKGVGNDEYRWRVPDGRGGNSDERGALMESGAVWQGGGTLAWFMRSSQANWRDDA